MYRKNPNALKNILDAIDFRLKNACDTKLPQLKKEISTYKSMEGAGESQWILIDFGDFVVNIFNEEKREYYNIDELYQSS